MIITIGKVFYERCLIEKNMKVNKVGRKKFTEQVLKDLEL